MAGFVRDHADHLVGAFAPHQQSGIDEQVHAAGDEGVQAVVVDQIDGDRRRVESGGVKQWRGINADNVFNLRVPQKANALLRGGGGER